MQAEWGRLEISSASGGVLSSGSTNNYPKPLSSPLHGPCTCCLDVKLDVQTNALATAPMSLNMSGWAAMGETGVAEGAEWPEGAESRGSDPSTAFSGGTNQEGSTMGSQLDSIAGWQAIAADVSSPLPFHT